MTPGRIIHVDGCRPAIVTLVQQEEPLWINAVVFYGETNRAAETLVGIPETEWHWPERDPE